MTENRETAKRIPELDGLRGIAILSVLVYHYFAEQGQVSPSTISYYSQRLVQMGWSGVDLFFVLSGFLIGGILLSHRESPNYYRTFYIRRFFRIVPIYFLWITAYVLIATFGYNFILRHSNSGVLAHPDFAVYQHYLFLQNLYLFPYAGIAGAWFSHLWSLAVEEQFYLFSPLVIRLVSGRVLKGLLFIAIVGAPLLRAYLRFWTNVDVRLITGLMPCRADSLAIGIVAALVWRSQSARAWVTSNLAYGYSALAGLTVGVLALWKWWPNSTMSATQVGGFSVLAFFYAMVLLLALAHPPGPIAVMARSRWLGEVGRVSYCMYIIHLAVNDIAHTLLRHAPPATTGVRALSVTVLAALATYGIAFLSWRLIEHPLLHLGHSYKY